MTEGEQKRGLLPIVRRAFAGFLLLLAVIMAVQLGIQVVRRPPKRLAAGDAKPAPELAGTTLSGQPFSLAAERGRVVLVDFWAMWCAPCIEEMPVLERLHRSFQSAGKPVTIVAADIEEDEVERVRGFARDRGLTFPIFVGGNRAAERYDVQTIPHLVLIDREGRLRATFEGPTREEVLRREIEALLLP